MISAENLLVSENKIENMSALIEEFYSLMCNMETLSLEQVKKLDEKPDFAFICKRCETNHAGPAHIWNAVVANIAKNTPAYGDPLFEEYKDRRKDFFKEVKHIKIRDYAEPFLRASDEGKFIEEAAQRQKDTIETFMQKVCSSKITPETEASHNIVISYYCDKHETTHYITPQQNNHYRSMINGAHVPEDLIPFLSKHSQRIVLRDASAVFREWNESHPCNKVDSIANQKKQEEKAVRRELEEVRVQAALGKKAKKQEAKASLTKKKTTTKTKETNNTYDNPQLYILKPHLMSEEWLIEYQICGRKVSYSQVSEALIFKHTNTAPGEYEVYECPYCSGWHLGHKTKKEETSTPARQAKSGLFWYRRNHKKANAFIHKIMLEDFV